MKLGDILTIQEKSKIKAGDGIDNGIFPFFTCSNDVVKTYNSAQYKGPALIFGTGGKASVHFCSEEFSTSTDCLVYKTDKNVNLSLINKYLRKNMYLLENGFKGAGLKHISRDYIANIELSLPSYDKQNKIVKQFDLIELNIKNHKKILDKYDTLIKSRFIEMFGDPVTNPKGWEIKKLSDYIIFLTSGSRGWSEYFSNDGELFLTIKNVKNNKISIENIQYVNAPNNKEAERTKVKENDLLISITADLGRTGVVSKEIANYGAYINQHLSLVRLNIEKVNPLFISFYLESDGGKLQFNKKNQSAVKAGLNFDAIKSLTFMNPPLKMQNDFVSFVQQIDKSKFTVQKSLEKAETLYKSLMQEYFG